MPEQLSLFDLGAEQPPLKPKQYYVHVGHSDQCGYNDLYICCVECIRRRLNVKGCGPCQNTEPEKCRNAMLVEEAQEGLGV